MKPIYWWGGALASSLGLVAVLYAFDPATHSFYPTCYWRDWTGQHCAGCGSLRSLHHLLHGELATAFRFNPLLILMLPVLGLWGAARLWRGNRPGQAPPRWPARHHSAWIWLLLGTLVVYTVARNLPLPALAWLSPP